MKNKGKKLFITGKLLLFAIAGSSMFFPNGYAQAHLVMMPSTPEEVREFARKYPHYVRLLPNHLRQYLSNEPHRSSPTENFSPNHDGT